MIQDQDKTANAIWYQILYERIIETTNRKCLAIEQANRPNIKKFNQAEAALTESKDEV